MRITSGKRAWASSMARRYRPTPARRTEGFSTTFLTRPSSGKRPYSKRRRKLSLRITASIPSLHPEQLPIDGFDLLKHPLRAVGSRAIPGRLSEANSKRRVEEERFDPVGQRLRTSRLHQHPPFPLP